MSGKRVTIRDVAKAANVSSSTVSNVLNNNDYHVSEETKQAVLVAMQRLGYRPPATTRSLMAKRISSLAIIISQARGPHILSDPMTAEAMRGITDYAKDFGYQILLHMTESWDPVHYDQTFREQKAESAIVLGARPRDPLVQHLINDGVPFVTLDHEGIDHPNVGPDHITAGEHLVQRLIAQGRSRFALITDHAGSFRSERLCAGILRALFVAGIELPPNRVVAAEITQEGGLAATATLLDRHADIDAILTTDDIVALGALRELRRRGIQVPERCAVIGYGNSPMAELTDPPLSSVELSAYAVGRQAIRWLSAHLRDDEVEPVDLRLPVQFVARGTGG